MIQITNLIRVNYSDGLKVINELSILINHPGKYFYAVFSIFFISLTISRPLFIASSLTGIK